MTTHLVDVCLLLREAELCERFILDFLQEIVLEQLLYDSVLERATALVLGVQPVDISGCEQPRGKMRGGV